MKVLTAQTTPQLSFIWRCCKNQTLQVFKAALGGKLSALHLVGCDAETLTRNIKRVLLLTAQEVLGQEETTALGHEPVNQQAYQSFRKRSEGRKVAW